jgi:hypothetical protein
MTIGSPLEGIQDKDADAVTLQLRTRLSELLDETIARYPDKPEGAPWIPKRHGGSAPTLDEAKAWEEERRARREAEKNANGS